jgi:hypothetical protein
VGRITGYRMCQPGLSDNLVSGIQLKLVLNTFEPQDTKEM